MNATVEQTPRPDREPEYMRPLDWVEVDTLPTPEYFQPTGDPEPVFSEIVAYTSVIRNHSVPAEKIETIKPPEKITTMNDVGIDFELLLSDARGQAGDKLRHVIRMGGSFEHLRATMTPRQLEAIAVEMMTLDASLYFHGAEQLRRMDRSMSMQQLLHQRVFADLHAAFGNSRATTDAYAVFRDLIPNFTPLDVKKGCICPVIHDNGEAYLGIDVPLELKNDPAYVAMEAGACVDYTTVLHFPSGSAQHVEALERRVAQQSVDVSFEDEDRDSVSFYLHPEEISDGIFGTERLHYPNIFRGDLFSAIERWEYVESGNNAFGGIKHNFQSVRSDQVLTQNLLRLGVSTYFNSLPQLMKYAERYIGVYDFLRQNAAEIEYYIGAVVQDIGFRQSGHLDDSESFFGVDPFINYAVDSQSDVISRQQAKDRFLHMAEAWKDWQAKDLFMKRLWETYFGTEHALTKDIPNVSFLQKTARSITGTDGPKVPVKKELTDMFGVGLDTASQEAHEAKVFKAAAA